MFAGQLEVKHFSGDSQPDRPQDCDQDQYEDKKSTRNQKLFFPGAVPRSVVSTELVPLILGRDHTKSRLNEIHSIWNQREEARC